MNIISNYFIVKIHVQHHHMQLKRCVTKHSHPSGSLSPHGLETLVTNLIPGRYFYSRLTLIHFAPSRIKQTYVLNVNLAFAGHCC